MSSEERGFLGVFELSGGELTHNIRSIKQRRPRSCAGSSLLRAALGGAVHAR